MDPIISAKVSVLLQLAIAKRSGAHVFLSYLLPDLVVSLRVRQKIPRHLSNRRPLLRFLLVHRDFPPCSFGYLPNGQTFLRKLVEDLLEYAHRLVPVGAKLPN
jgi:hypothetical protein